MNFNYRDFFIHNDDLHIIKEQLSIVDEKTSRQDALAPNAKAVWAMYDKGAVLDKQKIADTLKINPLTVQKIIDICEKKFLENKTIKQIADELNITEPTITKPTVFNVLKNTIGSDFKRQKDTHFINDAVKIYDHHKKGKTPEEIVVLVNNEKKEYLEKINLDKVNLILKVVDIAKNQMDVDSVVNAHEIEREIDNKISRFTILRLIKKLNLGKLRYTHVYTEEQDAFILFNYLQGIGPSASAEKFNAKFKTNPKGNTLNIDHSSIRNHLIMILKPKGESDISDYIVKLLTMYKNTYFPTVNIEKLDAETKDLLTHYRPPETVGGRDRTGTGTNRDMSAHLGTLPNNFNTMVTNLRNAHTIR